MSWQVFNAGVPGDATADLARRFERDVAAHDPDVVVLLTGVNDMLYPGHTVELAVFERNLRRLCLRCGALGARCVLGTLPPILVPYFLEQFPSDEWRRVAPLDKLAAAAAVVEQVALESGLPLWAVDRVLAAHPIDDSAECRIMNPANSGRRDGLHWTATGADETARELARVVRETAPGARRIVCLGDSLTYGVYLRGKGTARADAETYPGRLAAYLAGGA